MLEGSELACIGGAVIAFTLFSIFAKGSSPRVNPEECVETLVQVAPDPTDGYREDVREDGYCDAVWVYGNMCRSYGGDYKREGDSFVTDWEKTKDPLKESRMIRFVVSYGSEGFETDYKIQYRDVSPYKYC